MAKGHVLDLDQLRRVSHEVNQVLNKESDLAAVLIGAADLDARLGALLAESLIDSTATEEMLAPGKGVVGGLMRRATLAYVMPLIPKNCYHDCETIAKIRNLFAHHNLVRRFDDTDVGKLCDQFSFVERLEMQAQPARAKFLFAFILWSAWIDNKASTQHRPEALTADPWPGLQERLEQLAKDLRNRVERQED